MKNFKFSYAFLVVLFISTSVFSQEIEEVEEEETVIESTESYSPRKKVTAIYNEKENYRTGNIKNTLYIIKNGGTNLYGLKDKKGNILIKPMFYDISSYSSSPERIIVSLEYAKKGVINKQGDVIIPLVYRYISTHNDKTIFIAEARGYKSQIFDYNGKLLLKNKYSKISMVNNHIKVTENDLSGLYNLNGKEIFPVEYENITYNSKFNAYVLKQNGANIILTEDKKPFFKENYSNVEILSSYKSTGTFLVTKNNKKGVLDRYKKIIVPIKFEDIKPQNNKQLFIVKQKGYWGVYDLYFDKYLLEPKYFDISSLSSSSATYVLTTKDDKQLIKNFKSKTEVDITSYGFSNYIERNNYLTLKKNGKRGVIDLSNGKIIVPVDNKYITYYNSLISVEKTNKKYAFYSYTGELIVDDIAVKKKVSSNYNFRIYKVIKNGKAGLVSNGKKIAPIIYNLIINHDKLELAILKKNNRYSLINSGSGKTLLKASKEKITFDNSLILRGKKEYHFFNNKLTLVH